MTIDDLLDAPRHSRLEIEPTVECGVYGLFLVPTVNLGWFKPGSDGLIYIGKAEGSEGFWMRCHFVGRTVNHSPRKSLAVLLKDRLNLELRAHPDGKWGLSPESDSCLSDWMFANLRVAYLPTGSASATEKQLVEALTPPLNLNICVQGPQHRRISQLRKEAKAEAQVRSVIESPRLAAKVVPKVASSVLGTNARVEGAPAIADYFGLNPKVYRAALRRCRFAWHEHWGSWSVPHGSDEWRDMIAVAEQISGRRWSGVS